MSMCNVVAHGRLGKDPEYRQSQSGTGVTSFTIACKYRSKGQEETTWLNCVAFGKSAELIHQHFTKGKAILIQGDLKQEKWQDKDGNNRSSFKVEVRGFDFVGPREESPTSNNDGGWDSQPAAPSKPSFPDDVPF